MSKMPQLTRAVLQVLTWTRNKGLKRIRTHHRARPKTKKVILSVEPRSQTDRCCAVKSL